MGQLPASSPSTFEDSSISFDQVWWQISNAILVLLEWMDSWYPSWRQLSWLGVMLQSLCLLWMGLVESLLLYLLKWKRLAPLGNNIGSYFWYCIAHGCCYYLLNFCSIADELSAMLGTAATAEVVSAYIYLCFYRPCLYLLYLYCLCLYRPWLSHPCFYHLFLFVDCSAHKHFISIFPLDVASPPHNNIAYHLHAF